MLHGFSYIFVDIPQPNLNQKLANNKNKNQKWTSMRFSDLFQSAVQKFQSNFLPFGGHCTCNYSALNLKYSGTVIIYTEDAQLNSILEKTLTLRS